MSYSEIGVILLIYTGLFIYFLNPFQQLKPLNQYQSPLTIKEVLKNTVIEMTFQKNSLFALILFILASISIWLGFSEVENHLNAHSGKPLVNMTIKAVYFICGLFLYTIVLYIMLIFDRVLKVVRAYS